MSARPSWDETWMSIARTIAEQSYDPRLKVGCLIVSMDKFFPFRNRLLAYGYNGNYAGGPHEHESSQPGQSGFVHAEVNALMKCGLVRERTTMYLTVSPCVACAKLIINMGIGEVVYGARYRDDAGLKLLEDRAVPIRYFEGAP